MARSARDAGAWCLKRCRLVTPRDSVCGAPTLSETSLLPPADEAPTPDPGEAPIEVAEPHPPRRGAIAWWLVGLIIATDQIAKAIVRAKLAPFDTATIIPGLLDFIHVRNAGVAFGILNESPMPERLKSILTTAMATCALLGIGFYARHVRHHEKLARVGLS